MTKVPGGLLEKGETLDVVLEDGCHETTPARELLEKRGPSLRAGRPHADPVAGRAFGVPQRPVPQDDDHVAVALALEVPSAEGEGDRVELDRDHQPLGAHHLPGDGRPVARSETDLEEAVPRRQADGLVEERMAVGQETVAPRPGMGIGTSS